MRGSRRAAMCRSAREPACRRPRDGERGAVLMVVMMLMITLFGLGVTGLWLTSGNLQVAGNMNQRAQALYVAEAGIERARAILNASPAPDVNALLAGHGLPADAVPTGLNADGTPNGAGAILVEGTTPLANVAFPPASFARGAGTAAAPIASRMGSYTLWIRNDTAECRRGLYTTDANHSVIVRSLGLAPDNRTQVILEVSLGGLPSTAGVVPVPAVSSPVLCFSGKNGCDDNSSTIAGIVVK